MENLPEQPAHDCNRQLQIDDAIAEMVTRLPEGDTIFGLLLEQEMRQAVAQYVGRIEMARSAVPSAEAETETNGTALPAAASAGQLDLALFTHQTELEAALDDFKGITYDIAEWLVSHRGQKTYPRNFMDTISGLTRSTLSNSLQRIQEHPLLGQLLRVEGQKINRTYGMPDDNGRCEVVVESHKPAQNPIQSSPATVDNLAAARPIEPLRRRESFEPSQEFRYAVRRRLVHKTSLTDSGLAILEYEGERHVYFHKDLIKLQLDTMNILHIIALHPWGISLDRLRQVIDQVTRSRHTPAGVIDHVMKIETALPGESGWHRYYGSGPTGRREVIYKLEGAIVRDVSEWPDFLSSIKPQIMRQQLARLLQDRPERRADKA